MKEGMNVWHGVLTTVGGFFGWFLGGMNGFIYALLAFVIVDYITGVAAAFIEKRVSSSVGYKGIIRKVMIFVLVGIGNIIDTEVIQNGSAVRTAIAFFYLSNEGISILENASVIGLPIPKKLREVLQQLKKDAGETEEEDEAE